MPVTAATVARWRREKQSPTNRLGGAGRARSLVDLFLFNFDIARQRQRQMWVAWFSHYKSKFKLHVGLSIHHDKDAATLFGNN
jgi:hypothetical protein